MSLFNTLIPTLTRTPVRQHQDNRSASDLGPTLKPAYEVKESAEAYGLVVYLPGVAKDGLDLTAENGQITVIGRRAWKQPEGWTSLYRESADATFYLALTHENAVDADKIAAELNDGVLRVSLPKSEAVKPRKIAVN
jgi:HSP20 family molecular chaperone IbpA